MGSRHNPQHSFVNSLIVRHVAPRPNVCKCGFASAVPRPSFSQFTQPSDVRAALEDSCISPRPKAATSFRCLPDKLPRNHGPPGLRMPQIAAAEIASSIRSTERGSVSIAALLCQRRTRLPIGSRGGLVWPCVSPGQGGAVAVRGSGRQLKEIVKQVAQCQSGPARQCNFRHFRHSSDCSLQLSASLVPRQSAALMARNIVKMRLLAARGATNCRAHRPRLNSPSARNIADLSCP